MGKAVVNKYSSKGGRPLFYVGLREGRALCGAGGSRVKLLAQDRWKMRELLEMLRCFELLTICLLTNFFCFLKRFCSKKRKFMYTRCPEMAEK